MKTYAFVFARGGSKGVPGKNIRKLAGQPLLAYSIDLARKIKAVDKIFVSTDDQTIATIAYEYGADVINRPKELARDDTPEWLAWQHAVKWLQEQDESFDVFLSLPTTSPLRNKQDILSALKILDKNTDMVLTMTEATRSPWFNMVKKMENGYIDLIIENDSSYTRRQETPVIFDMTTVAYVTRPEFVKNASGVFDGQVKGIEIPAERALDIDTELDFQVAEFLMHKSMNSNMDKIDA